MKKATMDQTQQDSRAVTPKADAILRELVASCDAVDASLQNFTDKDDEAVQERHRLAWESSKQYLAAAPSLPESPQPPDVHLGRGDDEGASLASEVRPCRKCGQTDQGQTGEYACSECGLPTMWDAPVERAPSVQPAVEVRKAMQQAFALGQKYWQQADSESYHQNKLADGTRAKFDALVEETLSAISGEGE